MLQEETPWMRVGSLFSGIGGLDLGLERSGMEIAWQVEIDPWCRKVLEKHWPNVRKYGDVRELSGDELEPVDLICGGFPCQPVSVAGKRGGEGDERWLWPEFERILERKRPRWVVIENVRGLRTSGLDVVRDGLIALEYRSRPLILSACEVGAPHTRERLFVVAHAESFRCSGGWQAWPAEAAAEHEGCRVRERWSWTTQPRPVGVADGISHRVDRLRGLGNAVVPQVAEVIGRWIMEAEGNRECLLIDGTS